MAVPPPSCDGLAISRAGPCCRLSRPMVRTANGLGEGPGNGTTGERRSAGGGGGRGGAAGRGLQRGRLGGSGEERLGRGTGETARSGRRGGRAGSGERPGLRRPGGVRGDSGRRRPADLVHRAAHPARQGRFASAGEGTGLDHRLGRLRGRRVGQRERYGRVRPADAQDPVGRLPADPGPAGRPGRGGVTQEPGGRPDPAGRGRGEPGADPAGERGPGAGADGGGQNAERHHLVGGRAEPPRGGPGVAAETAEGAGRPDFVLHRDPGRPPRRRDAHADRDAEGGGAELRRFGRFRARRRLARAADDRAGTGGGAGRTGAVPAGARRPGGAALPVLAPDPLPPPRARLPR